MQMPWRGFTESSGNKEETMQYITLDESNPLELILLRRIAIDYNPIEYNKTLAESETFKK